MSKENLTLFLQKVQADEALQEKLKSLITQNAEDQKKMTEDLIEIGKESGYEFTLEDMQQMAEENIAAAKASGELDETQLEAVSGGFGVTIAATAFLTAAVGGFGVATTVVAVSSIQNQLADECTLNEGMRRMMY